MRRRFKTFARKKLVPVGRAIAYCVAGIISIFLLASGYESVYSRDLPLVPTLDVVDLRAVSTRYDLNKAAEPTDASYGNFGKPQSLKLPERSLRIDIVSPIKADDTWLGRSSTMHLLIPKPPRSGNIGLTMLYCRSALRTINTNTMPAVGTNIFIDTDKDWRYVYKVTSTEIAPEDLPHITRDDGITGKLLIVCNQAGSDQNSIIEASLMSVQGIL